jgi:hypothetical protein
VHGKVLTGENLLKRGFQGPFRCPLCEKNYESIQHLFWDCEFTKQVWFNFFKELHGKVVGQLAFDLF